MPVFYGFEFDLDKCDYVRMDKLLENAVSAIEIGVEDFQLDEPRRALSAIRNVYAGVLLLCKGVLWRHSPDPTGSLIYRNIVPQKDKQGNITWVRKGRQTVDRRQIKERFTSLGLHLDWSLLQKLGDVRNDVEHLFSREPEHLIRQALAEAIPLIRDLTAVHLAMDPKEVFSENCWNTLLENEQFFNAEKKACDETFDAIEWHIDEVAFPIEHFCCTECGSSLISQEDVENDKASMMELKCRQCGNGLETGKVLGEALEQETYGEAYIAMTDGGVAPITACPECQEYTFVREVNECVACDMSVGGECAVCGSGIDPDEYNSDFPGLCGYHAYSAEKALHE